MYAVIETGGKQYKVSEGMTLKVEKLDAQAGDKMVLDRVLLIKDENGGIKVGNPLVPDAQVEIEVLEQSKEKKVLVFKYKKRKNYRKKQGHRQPFSRIRIEKIKG